MKKTPVAVIGFLRESVLSVTLNGLAAADGALERDIYVYLSKPRNEEERVKTDAVRRMVETFKRTKLPNIILVFREENLGCSLNIRYAIDHTIRITGKVIVIEEDVLVSRTFLRYMDAALDFYEGDRRIWGINGYKTPFLNVPKKYKNGVFLSPRNMVWGWGGWLDRWEQTEFATKEVWEVFASNVDNMKRLVFAGEDLPAMLNAVFGKGLDAWDAQVSFYLVSKGLYCIEPQFSMTKTIGFCTDDAVHCQSSNAWYEKQRIYNFMPTLKPVEELLIDYPLLSDRFRRAVLDRRFCSRVYRRVMRAVKHYFEPTNNDPITIKKVF